MRDLPTIAVVTSYHSLEAHFLAELLVLEWALTCVILVVWFYSFFFVTPVFSSATLLSFLFLWSVQTILHLHWLMDDALCLFLSLM